MRTTPSAFTRNRQLNGSPTKMGRNKATKWIVRAYLTKEEFETIRLYALFCDMSLSTYLRTCALDITREQRTTAMREARL